MKDSMKDSMRDSMLSGGELSSMATASVPASAGLSGGGLREPIYADLNKVRAGSTSSNSVHWKTSATSIERRKSSFVDMDGS